MINQGLLIIDGAKNCVLLTKEDLERSLPVSDIIAGKVREDKIKQHNKRSELYLTVSDYLRGEFKPNYRREV